MCARAVEDDTRDGQTFGSQLVWLRVGLKMPSDDNDAHSGSERLATLGTSTHRSRNPGHPRIPVNKRKRKLGGKNARASALKKRGSNISKMKRLGGDLDVLDKELDERAGKAGREVQHESEGRAPPYARHFHLQNAPQTQSLQRQISVIMADLNTDREEGSRLTIPEVKVIVRDDPSLLEGYTTEEEAQMLADLEAKRDRKCRGRVPTTSPRMRISSAPWPAWWRSARTWSASRCSREATFTTRPPPPPSVPGVRWIFFRDILKKEPADVSALFELWAVNREKGTTGGNTLRAMQKECTRHDTHWAQRTKIAMNYENYISSMVEGKNVGLVGWPQGVAFKRMSLQSALPPLKILRDALKAGTCRWKVLTPTERERILKNFETWSRRGGEEFERQEEGERLSEELSEEDESGGEQASRGSGITVRQKLLALVEDAVKKGEGKGKASSNARFTKKARAPHEDTSTRRKKKDATAKPKKTRAGDSELPTKKRKKASAGDGNTDGEPPTKEKRKKASAEEDDSAPPAKRKKTSPREDEPAAPAVAKPRPKPRRLAKKAASPTVPVRSVSPTPPHLLHPPQQPLPNAPSPPLLLRIPCPLPRAHAPRSPATSAPASQAAPGRPWSRGSEAAPRGSARSYTMFLIFFLGDFLFGKGRTRHHGGDA
ncbi:hypothetical protein B0H14DRAFT_2642515 [Mycena olivaceomarginata]|nr:hypothetical protein B0H14DRAFT_2642515 [Mycena olivaceomarginata]